MQHIKLLRVALVALFLTPHPTRPATADDDQSPTLKLFAVPPQKPATIFGSAWMVYADGPIDREAPQRLADLIATNGIPDGSTILLNSPGGNLLSGIDLGRLIRRHAFRTDIGAAGKQSEWHPSPRSDIGGLRVETEPGECLSACALTFLGGSFRYASKGSVYGVHRFYSLTSSVDGDEAQIVSSAILQYIRDMGVDAGLFTEMTQAGRDDMKIIPENRLLALGVVDNGVGRTTWTIESVPQGLYMKGQRDTAFGYQKLIVMCGQRSKLAVFAVFDPQGKQTLATAMSAISLMINDEQINVPADRLLTKPEVNDGWINVTVAIDDNLIPRLETARTIGVALQFTYEAPVFLGIGAMDFAKGAQMLPGFLASCH